MTENMIIPDETIMSKIYLFRDQKVSDSWGGRRSNPYVFTEHGVLMLSSVLNSNKAIDINLQIVRIFTKMREALLINKETLPQLEEMRKSINGQEERIDMMYNYLLKFIQGQNNKRPEIGYKQRKK